MVHQRGAAARNVFFLLYISLLDWQACAAPDSKTNVFASEELGLESRSSSGGNIWKKRQQRRKKHSPLASRIIGGREAKQGRFPYIASLLTEGGSPSMAPECGGTLIAPDIVLTAAHCRKSRLRTAHVGRINRADPYEEFDSFTIDQQIVHPNYSDDNLDHDIMLLKLSGQSDNPLMALNRDPTYPSFSSSNQGGDDNDDELLVMGFGVTKVGGDLFTSSSHTLQIGTVEHVPNNICESAKSPGIEDTYQGRIKDDMLCAWGDGVDACQGDSGSALVAVGETFDRDVQLGITSWGYRCAHKDFPGVYSRVSYFWDWIASQICQISNNPPPAFKCSSNRESQSTGTTSSTTNSSHSDAGVNLGEQLPQLTLLEQPGAATAPRLVPVTLKISFDSYASEIGWKLKDAQVNLLASVPFGSYVDGRVRAIRTFFLQERKEYFFLIEDSYRDGLCCSFPGNYVINAVVGDDSVGRLLVLGKGDFGAAARHDFLVPASTDSVDEDTIWSNEVAGSLSREDGTIPLRLIIQLDDKPLETGWILERIGFHVEVVAQIPAGTYHVPGDLVDFSMELEEDELYRFTILDTGGDGIDGGRVRLLLGTNGGEVNSSYLLDQDGSFGSSYDHSFLASADDVPLAAPDQIEDTSYLTLAIRMDLYPEEISFQVRAETFVGAVAIERRASNVIFFRPPRFYNTSFTNQLVRETIPIPDGDPGSLHHFTLIMIDSFGDGLCCKWQGRSSNTGYTLYRGDPEMGEVLVSSSFSSTSREQYSFGITVEESQESSVTMDAIPPVGEVSVRVVLYLDGHPTETGYTISDAEGRALVDVPPGTLREKNTTLEMDHVLDPGVYTFAVVDSYGDGIQTAVAYELLHIDDLEGPPIVSADGDFETRREHILLLEGKYASVPLTIHVDSGDGVLGLVGFQLERLDLTEAEAVVATVPPRDTTRTARVVLQDGGLYRLSLLDSKMANFTGITKIAIGSDNSFQEVNISSGHKFLASHDGTGGIPPVENDSDSFLSLSIPSQLNSHEIDWVLLSLSVESWGSEGRAYTKRKVIAFGPNNTRSHENFRNEVETIPFLPPSEGKQTFMLIVTHTSAECCHGSVGTGLIRLFHGLPQDNAVLIGTSFEGESRLVEMFHLIGSKPEETEASSSSASFVGTAVIAGGLVFVFCYLLVRSFVYKRYHI